MRALSIAATGMSAQQLNLEVIANNIANVNTTGYKRSRAEFSDLMYQAERLSGAQARSGQESAPEGAHVGLGVRSIAVRSLHTQGSLVQTNGRLDWAISGRGWFHVNGPNGDVLYTRAGALNQNSTGQIVTVDGYLLQPQLTVPANTTDLSVNESGQVFAKVGATGALQQIGQLTLATFPNDVGLEPLGSNLYRETAASGAATLASPGDPGYGIIRQGYLEQSNVDAVKEITELISAQRSYEMNSKVIQAADEMYATVSKGMR